MQDLCSKQWHSYSRSYVFFIPYRTVDCYDTCIAGIPGGPLRCCADTILASEAISTTSDPSFLIARLFSPNEPDLSVYRLNTFCKWVLILHYVMQLVQMHKYYE